MARLAIIVHEGSQGSRELRLGRILGLFGVPCKMVEASQLMDMDGSCLEYGVFGSIRAIAAALKEYRRSDAPVFRAAAFYAYLDDERSLCLSALESLVGDAGLSFEEAPAGNLTVRVSEELIDFAGPMAGVKLSLRLKTDDAILAGPQLVDKSIFTSIILAGNAPVFIRFQYQGVPVFLCTSSQIVDIDQPVGRGFFDVKDHFCSVVPMVMFIKSSFSDVAWQPQELDACLIIDDPLLKNQYGFCNFEKLYDLMRVHGFTTNIAFIPWNWRRTSPAAGKFFGDKSDLFSVSVHGCDHTAGEFGVRSPNILHSRAQLARSRMRRHEARTGIRHDPIMIFPQGVFSSMCPEVLRRNDFLAAVNTEIDPVDSPSARTRIRDVWDLAIMTYGNFPIFTRRYAFHGLENFAFDLLLGKPCLIVAHHDSFKDDGAALIEFIEKLKSLNCSLRWRPLGQVIRMACRCRANSAGGEDVEMYGHELIITNPSSQVRDVMIRKRKNQKDLVSEILCDEKPIQWTTETEHLVFGASIESGGEKQFRVVYQEQMPFEKIRRSLRFEAAVAVRRILSEFRDGYLSRSSLLRKPTDRLKNVFRRAI